MNISPNDPSHAPYSPSGEVMDRMKGVLPGSGLANTTEERYDDLKKKTSSIGDEGTSDLKKSVKDNVKDDVKDNVNDEAKEKHADDKEDEKEETAAAFSGDADINVVSVATGVAVATSGEPDAKKRRSKKKWKKPKDKPNRPLSAYNLFFQKERALMLGEDADKHVDKTKKRVHRKTHGKISFAELARVIGAKWKSLPAEEKSEFEEVAAEEKKRYAKELAAWKEEQKKKEEEARKAARNSKMSSKKSGEGAGVSSAEQQLNLRMQMMQEGMHRGGFPFGADLQQRQMPTIDYLRARQDDRSSSMLSGNPFIGSSEATANALLSQFQGLPQQGSGMDGSTSASDMERLQQLQVARMQMMNSSMLSSPMGGPMGVSMMGGGMGMGGGFPSQMADLELQRLQQMRIMQMQGMNHQRMDASGTDGRDRSTVPNSEQMRRFQNRFNGM
mmetsp:Transcript_2754/g.5240  ORF Transcript_2754/g.5240 Transcript_2754/m.5240 type:complete len:444 (+) Transcript_2754:188-1519(+)